MRQQQLSRLVGIVWYKCQVHAYREEKKKAFMSENGLLMEQLDKLNSDTVQTHFVLSLSFFFFLLSNFKRWDPLWHQEPALHNQYVNDLRDDSGFWTNPQVNAGIHTTPFTVTPKVDTSSHYTHHKTQCVRKRHACAINLVKLKPGAL